MNKRTITILACVSALIIALLAGVLILRSNARDDGGQATQEQTQQGGTITSNTVETYVEPLEGGEAPAETETAQSAEAEQ